MVNFKEEENLNKLLKDVAKDIILIVSYLIISYDILYSAFKNVIKGRAFDDGITWGKFPIISYPNDIYTNWMTQNSVNQAINYAASAGSIIGGTALLLSGGGTLAGVAPIWARSHDNVNGVILCNSRNSNSNFDYDLWHMLMDLQDVVRR